jgi:hypothetical protein
MEKKRKKSLDNRPRIKYNEFNFIRPKGNEGNKTFAEILQRTGGWCEPVISLLCIAHPGAAVSMLTALEADAAAALYAGALLEAAEGCREAEPKLGGTTN